MSSFSVKIEGSPLMVAMMALNGADLPTLGTGAHWGNTPPPGWDLTILRAVVDADSADEARRKVEAALPPEGSYEIGDPSHYRHGD